MYESACAKCNAINVGKLNAISKLGQIVGKPNFPKNEHSYPLIRTSKSAYQGVRNVRFLGKFGVLSFLETLVLRFALSPYYRRDEPLDTDKESNVFQHLAGNDKCKPKCDESSFKSY